MGIYAEFDDVAKRFEGDLPEDRRDWVELRIDDAESELIGLIPALSGDILTTDPPRAGRVRRLIADKVLALYRNPDGAVTVSNAMGPFRADRTLSGQSGSWVSFTDAELAAVGYVKTVGTAGSIPLRAYGYRPTYVPHPDALDGGGP